MGRRDRIGYSYTYKNPYGKLYTYKLIFTYSCNKGTHSSLLIIYSLFQLWIGAPWYTRASWA